MTQRYIVFPWRTFCSDAKLLELFPQTMVTPDADPQKAPLYEIDLTDEELGHFVSQLSHHYDVAVRRRSAEKPCKGESPKPDPDPVIWLDARGGRFRQR